MLANDLVSLFIIPLNRSGLPYMVTGSVAAMLYGEPRLTHDIDLVVELQSAKIDGFLHQFPAAEFYVPPKEVNETEIARDYRGHLNIIHHSTGYKAVVYFHGNDHLHAWGMAKRKSIEIGGNKIFLAPPEYVIIRKLEYYRDGGYQKHLLDINAMFRIGGGDISKALVEEWVVRLSLQKEWSSVEQ